MDAIKKGWIKSAHDISDGGLAIALAEKAIFSKKGAKISVKDLAGTDHEVLFSEAQSGIVITLKPDDLPTVISHFGQYEVPTHVLGTVTGDKKMVIEEVGSLDVEEMSEIYEGVLPGIMG